MCSSVICCDCICCISTTEYHRPMEYTCLATRTLMCLPHIDDHRFAVDAFAADVSCPLSVRDCTICWRSLCGRSKQALLIGGGKYFRGPGLPKSRTATPGNDTYQLRYHLSIFRKLLDKSLQSCPLSMTILMCWSLSHKMALRL